MKTCLHNVCSPGSRRIFHYVPGDWHCPSSNAGTLYKYTSCLMPVQDKQLEIHISSFCVIPKCSQPGKWRLIVDLSSPKGRSINDGISAALCSLKYPSVHEGARISRLLGRGALMAKLDRQNAYRNIPDDEVLLGVQWKGQIYVDSALPFGLHSAPKIFTALADTLLWAFQKEGLYTPSTTLTASCSLIHQAPPNVLPA